MYGKVTRGRKNAASARRKADPYDAAAKTTAMKLKCNDLVVDMLRHKIGRPVLVLDSELAVTVKRLEAAGHRRSDLVVPNFCPTTCEALAAACPGLLVPNLSVSELLELWPTGPEEAPFGGKFGGMWLDFTGSADRAIESLKILFERSLLDDDCMIAITWCKRSGRRVKVFEDENNQGLQDAEAEITQLAEAHNFAVIKLRHNSEYKNMYFARYRFRKCTFSPAAHPDKPVLSRDLYPAVATCDEWDVEAILASRTSEIDAGQRELLVKYVGYDELSWQPEHMMREDVPELVAAFYR